MSVDAAHGTVIESVSFKARGEALNPTQSQILSCGGVFFSRKVLPARPLHWSEIINLPGPELSQKLFGLKPATYDPIELTFNDYVAH